MNYRLVCRLLGLNALLISVTMLFSLPWADPTWGIRLATDIPQALSFESNGFHALVKSILISAALGLLLLGVGGRISGTLYQKEAMAVVGLSWLLATVLGALPFYLCGTYRSPAVRIGQLGEIFVHNDSLFMTSQWTKCDLSDEQRAAIKQIVDAGSAGLKSDKLSQVTRSIVNALSAEGSDVGRLLVVPDELTNQDRYVVRWVPMSFIDAMFESQSGFSTTGATVISELEDPARVPHCILFWRSSTHFLGGLGIIVLFVVILGHGSAGKALMRNEVPGPSQEGSQARMQHTAWVFAGLYFGLTALLALLLKLAGLSWFDAICHSFGTMATGGFSTYNASIGHFDSQLIETIVMVFMLLAGMNFTLLYFLLRGIPSKLLDDTEWRTYVGVIACATLLVVAFGFWAGDFTNVAGENSFVASTRYGLFQVVSIMTTTGYGTHDFDSWNNLGRCLLFLLMFVGGCTGSTGGGIKVIRWVLLGKILGLELERAYHPRVIRPLRIGGKAIDDGDLRVNILVYFAVVGVIFILSWVIVVGIEPDSTWAGGQQHKLVDSASAVAATLNNIGPGLGTVGPTQNYGHFSASSKLLFTFLMMLGRVEVFAILVLAMPSFWRAR